MKINFNNIEKAEELPVQQPSKPRFSDRDFYNKNYPFQRIRRFLISRLGQSLDDVFSQFVKLKWLPEEYRNFNHFKREVETDTFIFNGRIAYYGGYQRQHYYIDNDSYMEIFYIHPSTRQLCFMPHKRLKGIYSETYKKEQAKTFRILGDYQQLIKVNGIWYYVEGRPPKYNTFFHHLGPKDRLLNEKGQRYSMANVVAFKRQLSSEELEQFGIKNRI